MADAGDGLTDRGEALAMKDQFMQSRIFDINRRLTGENLHHAEITVGK